MKKKLYLIALCIIVITILFIKGIYDKIYSQNETQNHVVQEEKGKVTRAEAAKMLCFLYYTSEEIDKLDRVIIYEDTDKSQWFDKYINGVYTMGLLDEEVESAENKFRPYGYLTFGECRDFLKRACMNQDSLQGTNLDRYQEWVEDISFAIEDRKESEQVDVAEWREIYELLIKNTSENEILKEELFVIGTSKTMKELSKWKILTDKGVYDREGTTLDKYCDQQISVYKKGTEILTILNASTDSVTLENVYLIEGKEQEITIFINGYKRKFTFQSPLSEEIKNVVGDLVIENGEISKVSVKPETINDRVLVANDKYIELENYGKLYLAENYKIYRMYDELMMELTNGILVGYNTTNFVVANGKICAALITDKIKAENIRVLLKTDGFADILHENVKFVSDSNTTIYYGKKEKKMAAGKVVTIRKNSKYLKTGRLRIETEGEEGKITLLSIKRNNSNPSYRGKMEVATYEKGLTVINELPLEEYLYGVIPSEMPTSYGLEPLKVQSICARSYAYRQLLSNSRGEYGAHVDDSVSYQVYNNIPENEASILAVKNTYGKVMEYGGEVIPAYYFSTSCGHTASSNEVWFSNKELAYLKGDLQIVEDETALKDGIDLTKEENFKKFITKNLCETYDSEFPWYRWNVEISMEDLKKTINANLQDRYNANPELIQVLGEEDHFYSKSIATIGAVKSVEITRRRSGGIVTEVIIKGTEHTIKVQTEYNIRMLLAPLYDKVKRQDDSIVENLSMLPSSFFLIKPIKTEGKVVGYTFLGGGYGHGVGMSQNGVKAMAEADKTYEEILQHYYKGIQIGFIY